MNNPWVFFAFYTVGLLAIGFCIGGTFENRRAIKDINKLAEDIESCKLEFDASIAKIQQETREVIGIAIRMRGTD